MELDDTFDDNQGKDKVIHEDLTLYEKLKRSKTLTSIAYFIGYFGFSASLLSVGPVLLALEQQTESNIKQLSYAFSANSVGMFFGAAGIGVLVDKYPK